MSLTSKSPKAVLLTALKIAKSSLPAHRHRNSPKKFTQHQLFACLVLKNFLKTDYRGLVEYLADCDSLSDAIELVCVAHYTTFQKAARRLLVNKTAQKLLDETVRVQMQRKRRVKEAAIDSTGLSATNASPYFVKRRATKQSPWKTITYRRYPKLGVVTNVANHFILAFESGKGPYPDVGEFRGLIQQAAARVKLKTVLADAGYDSEANHQFAREELALRTVIPPKHRRPSDKPAKGRYRRLMQTRFDEQSYRKRAQVETVMSMIKRRQGSFCKGKTYWSRCRELHLMALTHNIMILLTMQTFLKSRSGAQLVVWFVFGISEFAIIDSFKSSIEVLSCRVLYDQTFQVPSIMLLTGATRETISSSNKQTIRLLSASLLSPQALNFLDRGK